MSDKSKMQDMALEKKQIGIILPTNNPKSMTENFMPTLSALDELAPYATFLFLFQHPWTEDEATRTILEISNHGFGVSYMITEKGDWSQPAKIIKMREMCAALRDDCDYYLFIDDDFKLSHGTRMFPYSSGKRYLQSLLYLEKHKKCGVINTKSFFGGHQWGLKIAPTKHDMYATNRGLFLRNMKDHGFLIAPGAMQGLKGDLEESAIVFSRIELGYYPAKQMNNPTIHLTGKLDQYDNDPLNFHNRQVLEENVLKWIRTRYADPNWEYESKKLPRSLWDLYEEAGGVDTNDPFYTMNF